MFELYYKELVGYFSKNLGDQERAKDVVQETYLRISAMGEKATAVVEPRAFLYQVAKRIIIDEWRKEKNAPLLSLKAAEEVSVEEEPLEQLLSNARIRKLQNTIDALPPRSKEAFKLHKFEGYSHKEVAVKMGISKNAVEKLIIRALISCKHAVEDDA